jgi:hypothetical protein
MTDKERLDLIEHYGWTIKFIDGGCHIVLHRVGTYAFASTIREAFDLAYDKQAKWALNKN